ncbi:MAG TPA: methyltransferase [Pyrinomonadaceae bacterium]|nr:methyltransferase [Pyrinomonadaceae bacterium]
MTNSSTSAPQVPPGVQLLQIATGCFSTAALYVAVKLGIPDQIGDGTKTAAELASATGCDENSLYRTLRAIASIGILEEGPGRTFSNTPMSNVTRSDAPNSMRDMLIWLLEEPHWQVYGHLLYSVQTGKPAWDKVHGAPIFESLFSTHKELGEIFNRAMTAFSHQTIPPILASYDFTGAGRIADIAGGYGHLLGAVLQKYPEAQGVLFEIPPVLEGAPAMLDSYGVSDRVELVAGDFVESIPVEADIYMLKHIIHDWYDDKCAKILGNIRQSMPDDAKVLIIDAVVPPPGEPHFSKFLDLEMLMLPGGMERTADEFVSLLQNSGFKLGQIIPTLSPVSIVEAVKD